MPRTDEVVEWLEPAARQFPSGLPRSAHNTLRVMFRLLRDAFDCNPQCTVAFIAEVSRLLRIRLRAVQQMERHRMAEELRAENADLRQRLSAAESALEHDTQLAEQIQRLIGPHVPGQDRT